MKKFNNTLVDSFLLEKNVSQGVGKRMLEIYYQVFRLLYSSKYINLADISTYTTLNFKTFLGEEFLSKNWSSVTYNFYRRYLNVYCSFLVKEGYLEKNPIRDIQKRKESKKLPRSLNFEQVKEFRYNLENAFDKDTFIGLRNITLFYTYIYTGLRKSELARLKIDDIDLFNCRIKVIKGKGDKDRIIPITKDLEKYLYLYSKELKKEFRENIYLFPTKNANQLLKKDLDNIINKLNYCLTFKFSFHQLRHTFATELVKNNFDIYNISQILGHSSIDTTKIYLKVDTDRLKKQLDKFQLFS